MSDRTGMFLIFLAFSAASVAIGYAVRLRRPAAEERSRPLHLFTLVVLWSPVAMLSYWGLPIEGPGGWQLLLITLIQPVLMVAAAVAMLAIVRALRLPRTQAGVMILAAGLSNHGFTLGAYLCYALLDDGELAMRYGIAFVMSMTLFSVLIFYPIARHFGDERSGSIGSLIADSLLSIRAAPLHLSVLGVVLNLTGVPIPALVADWRVMDILFFAGAGAAYAGIGLRLHVGHSLSKWKLHGTLALVQFGFHPAATLAVIALLGVTGIAIADLPRDVILIEAFMPTAINVVILANLFGLDARLASGLWLWNSAAFCVIVLPVLMIVWL